jgi:hypothetical protein
METQTTRETMSEPKRFWPSPWGLEERDSPPPRVEFFPESESPSAWAAARLSVEDFWQHNAVFYNLLRGTTCHSDSYMTGVAYGNMNKACAEMRDAYQLTKDEALRLAEGWLSSPNTSIAMRIAVCEFARFFGVSDKTRDIKPDKDKWI